MGFGMWKDVVGYEHHFEVSDTGEIRSKDRRVNNWPSGTRLMRGRSINPSLSTGGYYRFTAKPRVHLSVHRVVAMAFLPMIDGLDTVNHINGIKTDNRVENLEWCTKSYNHKHAWESGLCDGQKRAVIAVPSNKKLAGKWYPFIRAAIADGHNPALIHANIHGKQSTHHGFCWDYCQVGDEYMRLSRQENGYEC